MFFYISSAFLSPNVHRRDNQVLNKFITAFEDETTIQNWLIVTNRVCLCDSDLFKRILKEVSDFLDVINDDKKCRQSILETIYILDSVKRILKIKDQFNESNTEKGKAFILSEDILNEEYEKIHGSLTNTIFYIGNDDDLERFKAELDDLEESGLNRKYLSLIWKRQLPKIISFLNASDDMLESILPVNDETPVYVESCFEGLECSLKCLGDEIQTFNMDKSTAVLSDNLNMRVECDRRSSGLNQIMLKYKNIWIRLFHAIR